MQGQGTETRGHGESISTIESKTLPDKERCLEPSTNPAPTQPGEQQTRPYYSPMRNSSWNVLKQQSIRSHTHVPPESEPNAYQNMLRTPKCLYAAESRRGVSSAART